MKRKSRQKYTEDDLLRAVAEVKNGNGSYRSVALKYNIPASTLSDKVKLRVPLVSKIGK